MPRSPTVPARGDAAPTPRPEPAGVRALLEQQREFRREQLARYGRRHPTSATSAAQDPIDEVETLVAAGAQRALADIELALAMIAAGRYGRCRVCELEIPLAVLNAVPQTTVCLSCLQVTDRSGGSDGRFPVVRSASTRPGVSTGQRS